MATSEEQILQRLQARYPLLLVVTHEEQRALDAIVRIAASMSDTYNSVWVWSFGVGFKELWRRTGSTLGKNGAVHPPEAIKFMAETKNALFVLKDFVFFTATPDRFPIVRALKDCIDTIENDQTNMSSIIMLDAEMDVPLRLEKIVHVIDFDLPTKDEITNKYGKYVGMVYAGKTNPTGEQALTTLAESAVGLTDTEIRLAASLSLATTGGIEAPLIIGEKKSIIKKSGVLEYLDVKLDLGDVGGLNNLKKWLRLRANSFGAQAEKYNLPAPRGILLVGVPGCGKSLIAKCIGHEWGMPVVRMDIGALYGSLVGASEGNLRRALKTIEAVSPAVLMCDEVEKALAKGGLDGGTSTRVFGHLLSWMQDHKSKTFFVATANDISALPPELLRAGRFDAIFSVDLPTESERAEILNISLRKYKKSLPSLDVQSIAGLTENFSGAELDAVVINGMYHAFQAGREPTHDDMQRAVSSVTPIYSTMAEKIEELRRWSRGRTIPASTDAVDTAVVEDTVTQNNALRKLRPRRQVEEA